jgi:hypothetical protein
MIDRLASWVGYQFSQAIAWYEHLGNGLQFLIAIVIALLVVGAAHVDELKREREWRLFRLWLEHRQRAMQLRLPRGMR